MGLEFEYINGQTPIDEDEKQDLLIKTVSTQAELNEFEQQNIEEAIQWVLGRRLNAETILKDSFVRNLHKRIGQKKFFQKLLQIDPLIKDRINSLDVQRSLRAYEIKSFTKKSMISWFKNTKSDYSHNDFVKICIDFPRKDLIERINKRSENMIKLGAISEVRRFIKMRVPKNKSLSKAIGINEIKQYLQKKIQIEQLIEKISIKTRQYAKRQSTWARGNMKDWNKLNPSGLENLLKKI